MIRFHFCDNFTKKITKESTEFSSSIYKKIEELENRSNLKNIGTIQFSGGVYVLRIDNPQSRVIIEEKNVKIENEEVSVFFVRDIVTSSKFGDEWGRIWHQKVRKGEWLKNNPLSDEDVENYIKEYELDKKAEKSQESQLLPNDLTQWFNEFELKLDNTIFETETWVAYALSNKHDDGMLDKYVNTFRILLQEIMENTDISEIINSTEEKIQIKKYEKHQVGILFSKVTVGSKEYFILFNGSHLENQKEHWSKAIREAIKYSDNFELNYESISRNSFRSYPSWTLNNDDLWFSIQKNDELSNLSLTYDQLEFLQKFKFPYYINGQAGSGKSTLLYYLFANVIYLKKSEDIKGKILFLTENEELLAHTKESILNLLEQNPEFNGLERETLREVEEYFNSFKNFLLSLVDESDLENFPHEKYLNFSLFKILYENSRIKDSLKKRYSAEEVWFTIATYIYGYKRDEKITSQNYESIVPSKSQTISLDRFKEIEKEILPFYENLLSDGYWDKLSLIRFIDDNINTKITDKYEVIVCDEAQDFSQVELTFILQQSKYLHYDLSKTEQVPLVFAGDPNQTVNPTGFKESDIKSLLHEELHNIAHFNYDKEETFYSPNLNYRSAPHIVNMANFIQYYRVKHFEIQQKNPQESKQPNVNNNRYITYFNYEMMNSQLKEKLIRKLQYKVFIVPVDSEEKTSYKANSPLLCNLEEDAELRTSVETKGSEYKHIVLYGFGEYFLNKFKNLENTEDKFERSYYFNKLYVAITRAKQELIIIDSKESEENFWKKIFSQNIDENWKILNDLKESLCVYNPDTINNILETTKEDALNNAKEDKKLGIHYENPARLKIASSQFFRLGEEQEANECLGHAEELKFNYKGASEFYIKANNYEKASQMLFKGRYFDDLENIGTNAKSIEHDIRLILSRIMNNENVITKEIDTLNRNRAELYKMISTLGWREDLLLQMTFYARKSDEKQSFIPIMKHIALRDDNNLHQAIAEISFELNEFEDTIEYYEKIDEYPENYFIAKLEIARQNNDVEKNIIYSFELIQYKEAFEHKKIYEEIIELYENNTSQEFSDEVNGIIYQAYIYLADMPKIFKMGKEIEEKNINDYKKMEEFYKKIMDNEKFLDKKVFLYLVERFAKVVWKLHAGETGNWIEEINKTYKEKSSFFNIPYKLFTVEDLKNISPLPEPMKTKPSDHLSHIKIENFRQFESITLEDIGQFNLILGDNNVGKTSLLEALLFMNDRNLYYYNLAFAYIARNNTLPVIHEDGEVSYKISKNIVFDFLKKNAKNKEINFELEEQRNHWKFTLRRPTTEEVKKELDIDKTIDIDDYIGMVSDDGTIKIDELSLILKKLNPQDLIKMQLIPFGKGFDRTLAKSYYDNIDKDKKNRQAFLNSMKIFIPSIDRITADTESGEIDIEETVSDVSAPLHQYGEGANKLFRILVQITLQKGKKLLIDEIDAGIHYSHFLEFWKIILKVAKENDVQIFATTHNLECLQYFKEVLELEEMQELQELSRTITLRRLPNSHLKAYTRLFKEFEYEIDNELEIRGGKL
jgi:ABC-type cobalamin/Fe3+-siderophores transport system ATPase subunit